MELFAFIGMGNMGSAMLTGCLKNFRPGQIVFNRADPAKGRELEEKTGVHFAGSALEAAQAARVVILAVKPQVYPAVLSQLKGHLGGRIVISLAPSYSIAQLKEEIGEDVKIVRAMPNTPAAIGQGMTGISFSDYDYTDEEKKLLDDFFTSFGLVETVPENLMDTVTAASGSSPAFVYMMIEALADGVVAYGMPRAKAYRFVAQAVSGAAQMVLTSGQHPGLLKDAVCSPGGTTIAAVEALERDGFRSSLMDAAAAVCDRCRKM